MTAKAKTALITDLGTGFPDNNARSITATTLRNFQTDLVDSLFDSPGREFQFSPFAYDANLAVGTGVAYMVVGQRAANKNLTFVHAKVITAGVTGLTTFNVYRSRAGGAFVAMLSTVCSIDSAETGSDTAASQPVINAANDDVLLYDLLRIDIVAVSTTPPKGLIFTLGFNV